MTVLAALADISLPLIMHYQPDMTKLSYILLGAINGLWLIMFIVFVVVTVKRRNRARLRAARTAYDEEQWDLESLSDVLPLTELFADMETGGIEKRARTGRRRVQDNYDKSQYIDQSASFDSICKRYIKHLSMFGVGITTQKAKSVLAAIGSSRLLVLRNEDKNLMRMFATATCRFFGSPEFYADAKGYRVPFDVFSERNSIKNAVTYAGREPHKMTIVALDGVDMRKIRAYFTPMIAAFANVTQSFTADIKNPSGEKESYLIPPNMWFLITESSPVNTPLPSFVTDFGAVINLKLSSVPSAGKANPTDGISYEQYTWMTDTCRNALNFDEANWKKIDKLEDFVSSQIPEYSVGNKKWGRLERFVSVYCACDGSESTDRTDAMREALDYTVATNLIHGMASAIVGRHNPESPSLLDAVDRIIGQDYDFETVSAIKLYNSEGISR